MSKELSLKQRNTGEFFIFGVKASFTGNGDVSISFSGGKNASKQTYKQTQIYQACSCKIFMLVHVGDICFVLKIFYGIIQKNICNLMSTFRLLRGMSVLRMKAYVLEFGSEITIQRYSFSEIFEIFS